MQYVDCFFVSTAGVVNQFSAIGNGRVFCNSSFVCSGSGKYKYSKHLQITTSFFEVWQSRFLQFELLIGNYQAQQVLNFYEGGIVFDHHFLKYSVFIQCCAFICNYSCSLALSLASQAFFAPSVPTHSTCAKSNIRSGTQALPAALDNAT